MRADLLTAPLDSVARLTQKIAREKAGVMKPGRPVLAVPQPEEAMAALQVGRRGGGRAWGEGDGAGTGGVGCRTMRGGVERV